MLALPWPHRRFLAIGIVASIFYAGLHSVSIIALLPVMRVMLTDEGLHGWVDRLIAERRLGAELSRYRSAPDRAETDAGTVVIGNVRAGSPLTKAGGHRFDVITTLEDQRVPAARCFERIAAAPPGAILHLRCRSPLSLAAAGSAVPAERDITVRLAPPPWWAAAVKHLTALLPAEDTIANRRNSLIYILALVCLTVVLSNACRFVSQYYVSIGVLRGLMDLRRDLYRKVLALPMRFFTRDTSDIVTRFVQDAQDIQRGLLVIFGKMIREPLRVVAILAVALALDWRLTVTVGLATPVAVLIFWRVGRSIRRANRRLLRAYGSMIGALGTTLQAIGIVKAYTSERRERRRLWRIDRRMFAHQLKIVRLEAFMSPLLEVIAVVAVSVAVAWLGSQVIRGRLKIEDFAMLVVVLGMLFDPLRKMSEVVMRVQRSAAGAERIFSVLDAPGEAAKRNGAVDLPPLSRDIEYREVTFRYPDTTVPALDRVDLTVRRGECIAVVGPNGAGKTTLTNMLLRFYDPDQGAVLIDGVDLRDVSLPSLRRQISLVTQDAVVFAEPMADNIAYGSSSVDRAAVVRAARRAFADEFICAMPQGYDTVPGERGSTLSGGQKQRLTIARAILRDAPILIFDEATSQIDAESEQKIQAALREFAKGRTTFVVAHRLSTIRFADRVVVMDAGRIVDTGTHDELLQRCPLYHGLCETQLVG